MTRRAPPWTAGLRAARANVVPGLIVQVLMLGVLLAYYFYPPTRHLLDVLAELKQIAPQVLILLGATAARSLLGKPLAVTQHRGLIAAPELAARVILTVHPSYLLRLPDSAVRAAEYIKFIADLKLASGDAGRVIID